MTNTATGVARPAERSAGARAAAKLLASALRWPEGVL